MSKNPKIFLLFLYRCGPAIANIQLSFSHTFPISTFFGKNRFSPYAIIFSTCGWFHRIPGAISPHFIFFIHSFQLYLILLIALQPKRNFGLISMPLWSHRRDQQDGIDSLGATLLVRPYKYFFEILFHFFFLFLFSRVFDHPPFFWVEFAFESGFNH